MGTYLLSSPIQIAVCHEPEHPATFIYTSSHLNLRRWCLSDPDSRTRVNRMCMLLRCHRCIHSLENNVGDRTRRTCTFYKLLRIGPTTSTTPPKYRDDSQDKKSSDLQEGGCTPATKFHSQSPSSHRQGSLLFSAKERKQGGRRDGYWFREMLYDRTTETGVWGDFLPTP